MPELKTMSAIKMLEDLKKKAEDSRSCLVSNIPEMTLDDESFYVIRDSINTFSTISTDILEVTRILRKGE